MPFIPSAKCLVGFLDPVLTMKKIAKLLAYSLVALMLAGGIARSAAAYSPQKSGSFNDNQIQYSDQYANSHVHQSQHVDQENNNHGGAVAVSVGHADRTPRDSIDGSGRFGRPRVGLEHQRPVEP